ncbi:MAG: hypothetical protein A2161_17795 [Candidatus Schekmanbacteria bacterium RBG_13_48_7]|uniref:DUF507 domain-containing protein n=1 Tax=Candidatus Schekmanbacteria bacterium RBG_13_48_7 TaxID=1817878 RepID=A0A1F7S976_9BACT|nr:MAG: hypothetical protein A2161_17795 [Candidatus Schekmanbacteria bacterium RBG_13_48_7]
MKLNDDKINHISHLIADKLDKNENTVFIKDKNTVRLRIREVISKELSIDTEVDKIARSKISKKVPEGSRQWDILYDKIFQEEMQKRGR